MPRKALDNLTESMFYVLMALTLEPKCGVEISDFIVQKTRRRVLIGPATLYTILGKFEKEKYIEETEVDGRKRTYRLTAKGSEAYRTELERLRACVSDAEEGGNI